MRPIALAIVLVVLQATSPPVLRFGDLANELTTQDLQSLRELSIRWGGPPWIIAAGATMMSRDAVFWSATIRLRAFVDTGLVRRGDQFGASTMRRGDAPRTWTSSAGGFWFWTQVKLPDREFDDVKSEDDINAPFATDGIVTDDELVSIVSFLRTDQIFKTERRLPIASIMRVYAGDDSWITLGLKKGSACVDGYQMRRVEQGWSVTWRGGVCA